MINYYMLIQTKLCMPTPGPRLLARIHLLAHLDEGLARRLTLVSAPAGAGKTTLVATWLRHFQEPAWQKSQSPIPNPNPPAIAWLSLDESDNDPGRFLTYLATALHIAGSESGKVALSLLQNEPHASLELMVTVLINELLSQQDRIILVLDDYHHIGAPAVHRAISMLVEQPPPCLHLVLVTRTDPPLPLARLRAHRQMQEIRNEELRFSLAETTAFLGNELEQALTTADIVALEQRTEGWAAGLQLAALSLRRHEDASTFIAGFSGRHPDVLDYLVQEVLQRQPSHIQEFLLQTSLLSRLNPSLCNAVTGRDDAHSLLHYLYRANLFLVALDDDHVWYRYHHLFAQVLCNRLRTTQPTSETMLHARAAAWFAHAEMAEEAIQHALSARDFALAANLISRFGERTWTSNRPATLLGWLDALPTDIVRTRPYLGLLRAWSLWLISRWYAVAPALEEAEASLSLQETQSYENDPPQPVLEGIAAAIRANLALSNHEPAQAIHYAQISLRHLPATNFVWRAIVSQISGDCYRAFSDWQAATQSYDEAILIGQATQNIYTTLSAIRSRAELFHMQGRLHMAEAGYRRALQLAEEMEGRHLTATANCHIWLARLLCEWNQLQEAQRHLEEAIAICRPPEYGVGLIMGHAVLAELHYLRGDVATAWTTLHEAQKLARIFPLDNMQQYVQQVEVQFHLTQASERGDSEAMQALVVWAQHRGYMVTTQFEQPLQEAVLYAHFLLVQGLRAEALEFLSHLRIRAQRAGQNGIYVRLLNLEALALMAEGSYRPARKRLRQALDLAAPERMVRPFLISGSALMPLLEQLRRQRVGLDVAAVTAAFADRLQPILVSYFARQRAGTAAPPISFTNRESDVIPLLAAGLSSRQIAQQLVVAESTVKTHLNNIYRKLAVNNRTQAASRLRDLKLI